MFRGKKTKTESINIGNELFQAFAGYPVVPFVA